MLKYNLMEFSLPVKTVKTQSNFGIIFDPVQIRLVAGETVRQSNVKMWYFLIREVV